jgi:hypothetical protein
MHMLRYMVWHRSQPMTDASLPTSEQEQRAKWDLLLLDIEQRTEQVRQMKTYEPHRLLIQAITALAALLGAGAALGALVATLLLRGHP